MGQAQSRGQMHNQVAESDADSTSDGDDVQPQQPNAAAASSETDVDEALRSSEDENSTDYEDDNTSSGSEMPSGEVTQVATEAHDDADPDVAAAGESNEQPRATEDNSRRPRWFTDALPPQRRLVFNPFSRTFGLTATAEREFKQRQEDERMREFLNTKLERDELPEDTPLPIYLSHREPQSLNLPSPQYTVKHRPFGPDLWVRNT